MHWTFVRASPYRLHAPLENCSVRKSQYLAIFRCCGETCSFIPYIIYVPSHIRWVLYHRWRFPRCEKPFLKGDDYSVISRSSELYAGCWVFLKPFCDCTFDISQLYLEFRRTVKVSRGSESSLVWFLYSWSNCAFSKIPRWEVSRHGRSLDDEVISGHLDSFKVFFFFGELFFLWDDGFDAFVKVLYLNWMVEISRWMVVEEPEAVDGDEEKLWDIRNCFVVASMVLVRKTGKGFFSGIFVCTARLCKSAAANQRRNSRTCRLSQARDSCED